MNILTLAAIAAGILLVIVFVIRRIASSNSGTESRSRFNIENSDPAPLHFTMDTSHVAKAHKEHQEQIQRNAERSRKIAEDFQKRSGEFQKQAADAAERARKSFEESGKRNQNLLKQIKEPNKRYMNMWG
jgi:DNA anti-recombination protein RmuC